MRELPMAVKALHAVSRIRFGSASQVRPSVASASTKSTCRMSEYLTDRRTGKDSLTSVSRRKARPPRSGTVLVWYRSEEHTSELQSLMRISYAVFCLKKKRKIETQHN